VTSGAIIAGNPIEKGKMFGIPVSRVEEIEQIATDIWQRFCLRQLPVATRDVISAVGIQLYHLPAESGVEAEFDLRKPPYFLGLRSRRENESERGYRRRMRFTEAHELGHFFLHQHVQTVHRESYKTVIDAIAAGNSALAHVEIEANCFAAELLMPKHAFTSDLVPSQIRGGMDWLKSLSQKYNVSSAAVELRIARLRNGFFLSGYAWPKNGDVHCMIPSLELELGHPAIAESAWKCNPNVRGHTMRKIPAALLRDFQAEVRRLPGNDIAAVKIERDNIVLGEILRNAGNNSSGSVYICGCNRGDGPKIYFEIELTKLR
jgi:hypothetical protein